MLFKILSPQKGLYCVFWRQKGRYSKKRIDKCLKGDVVHFIHKFFLWSDEIGIVPIKGIKARMQRTKEGGLKEP
ncbi:MAG: hypothetical protein C0407_01955 [Desulfobacca sp.]|nr:hypothetical protein [Desulfobacca sp.]